MIGELLSALIYLAFDFAFSIALWNWSNDKESPSFKATCKLLSAVAFFLALMQAIVIYKIVCS